MTTKTELSPSARKVLKAAYAGNGFLFADSGGLKGGPAIQVRKSLLNAGLIEDAPYTGQGDAFVERCGLALKVTDAGINAIGSQKPAARAQEAAPAPDAAPEPRAPRAGSKQAQLIDMLRRTEGATVDECSKAFGWLPHTTRAAISTLPKKDASLKTTNEKVEGRGRVYRLAQPA